MATTSTIELRISDNVLDEGQWPIARAVLRDGIIKAVHQVHAGVYTFDAMPQVGASVVDIAAWTRHDSTGRHPENYYECRLAGGKRWLSFVSVEDLTRMLGLGL